MELLSAPEAGFGEAVLHACETLFAHATEGIALLDSSGRVRHLSPSARRLLGLEEGVEMLLHAPELLDLEALERVVTLRHGLAGWRRWMGSARTVRAHDLRVRGEGGSWRWVEVHLSNRLRDPRWKCVVVNARDVTHERAIRLELEQTLWELEAAQREVGAANAAVQASHDSMQAREAQLHSLFDNVLAAVLVTDGGETPSFLQEDPQAADWMGLGSGKLVNISPQDFMAPQARSLVPPLRDFRDLFENTSSPESAEVQEKTLFFSDLKNSSTFYEVAGDEPAYGLVKSHFEYLFAAIERNRGSIVKTIGDAVMAAFDAPHDALRASLEMQDGIAEFNRGVGKAEGDEGEIILKIGLHHGPVIAVRVGEAVDYFGRTVNIAARLSAACMGRDIVASADVWEHPEAKQASTGLKVAKSEFQGNLKGIHGVFKMYRLSVGEPSGQAQKQKRPAST